MDAHEEYLRRRRKALRIIAAVFAAVVLLVFGAIAASVAMPECSGADPRPIEEIYRIEAPTDTIAPDSTRRQRSGKKQPAPRPERSPLDEAVPSGN